MTISGFDCDLRVYGEIIEKIGCGPVRILAKLFGIGGFLDTTALWSIVFGSTAGARTVLIYYIQSILNMDLMRPEMLPKRLSL